MVERFVVVILLVIVVHMINTLSYSVRLAGVRTQRLLTTLSLYNIINILANICGSVQIPLLTSILEHVIKDSVAQAGLITTEQLINMEVYRAQLVALAKNIRLIIAAASLGTLAGVALIPVFIRISIRATRNFEENGSVIRTFWGLIGTRQTWRLNNIKLLFSWRYDSIRQVVRQKLVVPKYFLLVNIVVTGLYTTGMLSPLYAGALFPDFRSTAAMLSAIINGFASVLSAMVVEPTVSSVTDGVLCGERGENDVKQLTLYLALTRFIGTLAAQVMFLPGAYFIKFIAGLLA